MIILSCMQTLCYINEYTTCMSAGVEIQLSSIWLLFAPAFYDIGCPKKYNTKIVLFAPCLYKNRLPLFPNVFRLYLEDNSRRSILSQFSV